MFNPKLREIIFEKNDIHKCYFNILNELNQDNELDSTIINIPSNDKPMDPILFKSIISNFIEKYFTDKNLNNYHSIINNLNNVIDVFKLHESMNITHINESLIQDFSIIASGKSITLSLEFRSFDQSIDIRTVFYYGIDDQVSVYVLRSSNIGSFQGDEDDDSKFLSKVIYTTLSPNYQSMAMSFEEIKVSIFENIKSELSPQYKNRYINYMLNLMCTLIYNAMDKSVREQFTNKDGSINLNKFFTSEQELKQSFKNWNNDQDSSIDNTIFNNTDESILSTIDETINPDIYELGNLLTQTPIMIDIKDLIPFICETVIDTFILENLTFKIFINGSSNSNIISETTNNKFKEMINTYYKHDEYLYNQLAQISKYTNSDIDKETNISLDDAFQQFEASLDELKQMIINLGNPFDDNVNDDNIDDSEEVDDDNNDNNDNDVEPITPEQKQMLANLIEELHKDKNKLDNNPELRERRETLGNISNFFNNVKNQLVNKLHDDYYDVKRISFLLRDYWAEFSDQMIRYSISKINNLPDKLINKYNDNTNDINITNNLINIHDEARKKFNIESTPDNLFRIFNNYIKPIKKELDNISGSILAVNDMFDNSIMNDSES